MLQMGISLSQLPGTEGGSWSEKAKGEEKSTFRQGRSSSWSPTGRLFSHNTAMLMVSPLRACWSRGAPCLHNTGEHPQQSRSDKHMPPSCLQLQGQENHRLPLLHSGSAARYAAWGKALLCLAPKTPISRSPKPQWFPVACH